MKVLIPCSDQPLESLEEDQKNIRWQGSETILLVDDEETVRTVSKQMLEQRGFDILLACDGREALEVFRSHMDKVDVVLMDLTMPHMNGEETFRELRQLKPDVRVVLMSGYNEQDVTGRFSGKGLAGFIQKPFGQRDLIQIMQAVFES